MEYVILIDLIDSLIEKLNNSNHRLHNELSEIKNDVINIYVMSWGFVAPDFFHDKKERILAIELEVRMILRNKNIRRLLSNENNI